MSKVPTLESMSAITYDGTVDFISGGLTPAPFYSGIITEDGKYIRTEDGTYVIKQES